MAKNKRTVRKFRKTRSNKTKAKKRGGARRTSRASTQNTARATETHSNVFTTKNQLKIAIGEYISNKSKAEETYGSIGTWDVRGVTDMSELFEDKNSFNADINGWDVSNVTNMNGMFRRATSFNQPLASWNVSNVTTMNSMFSGASSFNQPLNTWNVSNVTDMSYMFSDASKFDKPLYNWDVSNVTKVDSMFKMVDAFEIRRRTQKYIATQLFFIPDTITDDMVIKMFLFPAVGRGLKNIQRQIKIEELKSLSSVCFNIPKLCEKQDYISSFLAPEHYSKQYSKNLMDSRRRTQQMHHDGKKPH